MRRGISPFASDVRWVALDRAVRLASKRSLPAPLVEWAHERDLIADDIWTHYRHPEHGYFVQSRGGRDLDAALLMMPLVRFVSATDPVWLATLDAIGEQLADDGLVFRYHRTDGLEGGEGRHHLHVLVRGMSCTRRSSAWSARDDGAWCALRESSRAVFRRTEPARGAAGETSRRR